MTLPGLLMIHTFVAGMCGTAARIYIGGFLLSTESLRSTSRATRYFYRYLVFSLYFMISVLFMPLFIRPFLGQIEAFSAYRDVIAYLYLLACAPVASLLFWLDFRFIARTDGVKIHAREILKINRSRSRWRARKVDI